MRKGLAAIEGNTKINEKGFENYKIILVICRSIQLIRSSSPFILKIMLKHEVHYWCVNICHLQDEVSRRQI